MNPEWTEQEVQVLLDMHAAGMKAREIAEAIPRSYLAVNSKRCRLGLYVFPPRSPFRIADVIAAASAEFGVPVREILSECRERSTARARQAAMYLARELTLASYSVIGRAFNRDHTTVIHGCRIIEQLMATDRDLRRRVEAAENSLKNETIPNFIHGGGCFPGGVGSIESPMEQSKILEDA
jgi:hypothetical protein